MISLIVCALNKFKTRLPLLVVKAMRTPFRRNETIAHNLRFSSCFSGLTISVGKNLIATCLRCKTC